MIISFILNLILMSKINHVGYLQCLAGGRFNRVIVETLRSASLCKIVIFRKTKKNNEKQIKNKNQDAELNQITSQQIL